ncbi:uncharacterized protein LOC130421268 [Triplophysa dalaica]|uniref:uncharacterized protein LOC130421268 n=1 Tax=Triplophysa dalaica TaxID=1582913 RepID=UPI0024DFC1A0|nr:uncharacterized protein LOC130421268 [Triplophysa dalaica]
MNMSFALVEWKEETDNESWSIVSTTQIKNFDKNDFLDGLDETSVYLIEWRGGLKKKPKGGWPLYEATVHKIAERQSTLEKIMRTQHHSSPKLLTKRKYRPNPRFAEEETGNNRPSSPKKKQASVGNLDKELLEKIKVHHGLPLISSAATVVAPTSPGSASLTPPLPKCPTTPSSAPPSPGSSTKSPLPKCPAAPSSAPPASPPSLSPASPLADIIGQLKAENEVLRHELENLKTNVVSQMPKLLNTMCKLGQWLEANEQSSQKQMALPSSLPENLEIHPGSGVYVPRNVLWSASHANSPTTMARMLLLGVFDIEVLLKSNLRGGKSRNANSEETKEALDRDKINAIMNAVIQKFPGTTRGQIGTAINQKVTELRLCKKTQQT